MNDLETARLEDTLIEAACAGGAAVMRHYGRIERARCKADDSPVTEADEAAEAAILMILARRAGEIPVVAEEAVAHGRIPPPATRFFLVDALDGTREFLAENGEFTVNIALVENGAPVAGVVYAPALGRIFTGIVGQGAHEARVIDGMIADKHPITARRPPEAGLVVVMSRTHCCGATEQFLADLPVAQRLHLGSSLKFGLLAAGEADLYPRFGPTMEWDTAAGHAVLIAAGGCVADPAGARLVYGKGSPCAPRAFANPEFIASGQPAR